MRVFLDANILFSAVKSRGAVHAFLNDLKSAGHTLVADAYVAEEARWNLERKVPSAMGDFEKMLACLEISAKAGSLLETNIAPGVPEKDRPVLAAAIQHRCHVLLTGDKTHFGALYEHTIEGVEVRSPASFARKLEMA